jgi:hypothetical protein
MKPRFKKRNQLNFSLRNLPLGEKMKEYRELALFYGGNYQKGSEMFLVEGSFYVFNVPSLGIGCKFAGYLGVLTWL